MSDKIEGFLEVGTNGLGEVVVNLDHDRTGHIVFSPGQARQFANILVKQAALAEGRSHETQVQKKPTMPKTFDLDDSGDVKEALSLAEEIESLASELPEEGEDFGISVIEKAADIARNIEAHGRVTDNQFAALENMLDGLRRWFHD